MYGSSGLRRPFSPDPNDPAPSAIRNYGQQQQQQQQYDTDYEQGWYGYDTGYGNDYSNEYANNSGNARSYNYNRREASDVSVEALDLADYAQTFRRSNEPTRYNQQSPYPLFSPNSLPPPSPVSRVDTLTTSHGPSSRATRSPRTPRRPTSLPAAYRSHNSPYLHDPALTNPIRPSEDMNISHFPPWSRSWYNSNSQPPPEDIYTPLPKSQFHNNSTTRSPFDPDATLKYPYSLPDYHSSDPFASSSHIHDQVLPWSSEPPEYGSPINPFLKEERLRMLEREFGPNSKSRPSHQDDFLDEDGKPLIGTVDSRGNIVTQGPRKRKAIRALQILLAGVAAVPGIYAALAIKVDPLPPPAGKPAAFILYIFSVLFLLALLWLFLFQPCCCGRRKVKKGPQDGNPLSNGMMVLPVPGLSGGKKPKKAKGKKGKKGRPVGGNDVQVNLIVDPNAFGNGRDQDESDEYFSEDGSMPGGFGSRRPDRRRPPKRRSVFVGLAMEEAWKKARTRMKKILAFDILGGVLWLVVFVFILIGPRCPSSEFEGWCNCYNVSSAAACLLVVTFSISTFFIVKDLHTCKTSPRTRT